MSLVASFVFATTALLGAELEGSALVAVSRYSVNWSESVQVPTGATVGLAATVVQHYSPLAISGGLELGWTATSHGGPSATAVALAGPTFYQLRLGFGLGAHVYGIRNYRTYWTAHGADEGTKYNATPIARAAATATLGRYVGTFFVDRGWGNREYTATRVGLAIGLSFL